MGARFSATPGNTPRLHHAIGLLMLLLAATALPAATAPSTLATGPAIAIQRNPDGRTAVITATRELDPPWFMRRAPDGTRHPMREEKIFVTSVRLRRDRNGYMEPDWTIDHPGKLRVTTILTRLDAPQTPPIITLRTTQPHSWARDFGGYGPYDRALREAEPPLGLLLSQHLLPGAAGIVLAILWLLHLIFGRLPRSRYACVRRRRNSTRDVTQDEIERKKKRVIRLFRLSQGMWLTAAGIWSAAWLLRPGDPFCPVEIAISLLNFTVTFFCRPGVRI